MADRTAVPDLELNLFSDPKLLAAARSLVGNYAQRLGFNEIQCGQVSLALDEALCNIINHGYEKKTDGRIRVCLWETRNADTAGIRIVIEDRAKQVDPETIRSRDLDDIRPGGLGVYIIREIMDEVHYEHRDDGGMRLTLLKQIPTEQNPDQTEQATQVKQVEDGAGADGNQGDVSSATCDDRRTS